MSERAVGLFGAEIGVFPADRDAPVLARLLVVVLGAERVARLGDAEVGHLDLALVAQEHVLRADVAVDDPERSKLLVASPVGVIEPLGDLGGDVGCGRDGDRLPAAPRPREQRREVEPVHVLHRDEQRLAHAAEIEHLHHVRVREAHRELGLAHEHLDELGLPRQLRQDPLDDEDLLEAFDAVGLGTEDLGHPALADLLEERIPTEGLVLRRRVGRGRAVHRIGQP
jgi:hypothetical protein